MHDMTRLTPYEKETKERLRRIETRLTKFMEAQGFDTQTQKPEWLGDGRVEVPTDGVALRAILDVVPKAWDGDVQITVTCKGKFVIALFMEE